MALGDWPEEEAGGGGRPSFWAAAGLVAAVLAFGLIPAAIYVSTFEVDWAIRVYGPRLWIPGEPVALRVVVTRIAGGELVEAFTAEAWLEGPAGRRLSLGSGAADGTRSVQFGVGLPGDLEHGGWTLVLEVQAEGEAETVRIPVEVGEAARLSPDRWLSLRNSCEEGSRLVDGTWQPSVLCAEAPEVRVYPESGALVANLENAVLLFAPGRRSVSIQPLSPPPAPGLPPPPPSAPPEVLVPDRLGFARWRYTPTYPRGRFRIVTDGVTEEQWIRDLPAQIHVQLEHVLLRPGARVRARVQSLRTRSPLYLDVWVAGRWVSADAVARPGRGGFEYELALPETIRGPVALRVYTHPDGPLGAYDERVFWISDATGHESLVALVDALATLPPAQPLAEYEAPPGPEPLVQALRAVAPERVTPRALEHAARALLSRVEVAVPASPRLVDTTEAKLEALRQRKARLRRPILLALVGLAAVVFGVLLVLLTRHVARTRRQLGQVELDRDVEDPEARPIRGSGMPLYGILLVLILLGAVVGLIVLLQSLRWSYAL